MEWSATIALFERSANEVADLIEDVTDFDRPGLGDWDLAGLIGHFVRAIRTPMQYLTLPEPADAPLPSAAAYPIAYLEWRRQDTSAADTAVAKRGDEELTDADSDLAALIRREAATLHKILAREAPSRLVPTRFGPLRLDDYLRTRALELVVHGLDIARALDRIWSPPRHQLHDVLGLLTEVAIEDGKGVDLVLALSGRTPPPVDSVLPVIQ